MSEPINDGGPAFPVVAYTQPNGNLIPPRLGMSLRDWFAGQAMVVIMGGRGEIRVGGEVVKPTPNHIAAAACTMADAMLAALGGAK